jgi:hypothetical protein
MTSHRSSSVLVPDEVLKVAVLPGLLFYVGRHHAPVFLVPPQAPALPKRGPPASSSFSFITQATGRPTTKLHVHPPSVIDLMKTNGRDSTVSRFLQRASSSRPGESIDDEYYVDTSTWPGGPASGFPTRCLPDVVTPSM